MFLIKDDASLFSHVIMVLRTRDSAQKAREAPGMEIGDGALAPTSSTSPRGDLQ